MSSEQRQAAEQLANGHAIVDECKTDGHSLSCVGLVILELDVVRDARVDKSVRDGGQDRLVGCGQDHDVGFFGVRPVVASSVRDERSLEATRKVRSNDDVGREDRGRSFRGSENTSVNATIAWWGE